MAINGPVNYYNFENNIITIDGRRLGMWGTDGGVSYASKSDLVQSDVGADGVVHYSGLNDDRLEVTITLMEDSDSVAYLMQKMAAQQAAMKTGSLRSIPPMAYRHRDLGLGDIITSAYAIFMNVPDIAKARTIGTRVFRLELPYAKGGLQLATLAQGFVR